MSVPKIPLPARVLVSLLTPRKDLADQALPELIGELGPLREEIGPIEFGFTTYYEKEMGPGIRRWLWIFEQLVDRERLFHIKCLTNRLEQLYTIEGRRQFNLDPGLLSLENLVLATGKNRANRIYLRDGIFADLTLMYVAGRYRPLEWTYPDYADARLLEILNRLREGYKCQLKQYGHTPTP
ncbi:MAG: DUF4416 family protein [Thermodesulfobacteriota bacterium]